LDQLTSSKRDYQVSFAIRIRILFTAFIGIFIGISSRWGSLRRWLEKVLRRKKNSLEAQDLYLEAETAQAVRPREFRADLLC
jgi:hypothetical protein